MGGMFAWDLPVTGDISPEQWTGRQAVVRLPEHLDVSSAAEISDALLAAINRGAVALIADMTAMLSCDHAGADALVRTYQRAVVSGTQFQLVITAPIVRRVFSWAPPACDEQPAGPLLDGDGEVITPKILQDLASIAATQQENRVRDLLDTVITTLFAAGFSLQAAATDQPTDAARERITTVLSDLDDTIRAIRDTMFPTAAAHHPYGVI